MVDFTRAPGTPAQLEANDKAASAAADNTPMMDYNDATDNGVQAEARAQSIAEGQQQSVGFMQSLSAGAKSSVLLSTIAKANAPDFDPEPGFNPAGVMSEDQRIKQIRPDQDEIKYLQGANSLADYQYRMGQIPKVRQDQYEAAQNPITGVVGAVGADLPSMLIPGLSEAAFGRTAGTAVRLLADTYDAGSALYSSDQLGQSAGMNAMVAGTGVVDMLHILSRGFARASLRGDETITNAAQQAENAAAKDGHAGAVHTDNGDDALAHAVDTGAVARGEDDGIPNEGKASDMVIDPDNPTIPPSTRDIDDDLQTATAEPVANGAPAYADLSSIVVNTNKAKIGKAASSDAIGQTLASDVPMQPVMQRALARMDELAASGDLPADFPRQYRALASAIADSSADVPIHFDHKANFRPHYNPGDDAFNGQHIRLSFPKAAVGKGKLTVDDLVGHMDATDLRELLHESVHAASSRVISRAEQFPELVTPAVRSALSDMDNLRAHLTRQYKREVKEGTLDKTAQHYISYYLKDNHELVAGLGDSRGGYQEFLQRQQSVRGKESALRQLGKQMLRVLGIRAASRTGMTDVADALEDMMAAGPLGNGKLGKQALSRAAPDFASDSMADMTAAGREAALKAPRAPDAAAAKAMLRTAKTKFNQWVSLRDDIARGDDAERNAFADRLVADGTRIGERSESAVDLKRLMKSEMDAVTAQVEKSITDELSRRGTGKVQQFFYRKQFVQARKELEQELGHYLDYAHAEHRAGRTPEAPTDNIKPLVDAYVNSGWAERWFDHLQAAGLNKEQMFEKSPYYLPRRYSSDKLRALMRDKGLQEKDIIDIFSKALRDAYPAMGRDLSRQVARTWHQGLTSAQPRQGVMWRKAINGMSNDEFVQMLTEHGIDAEQAQKILDASVFNSERTGSNQSKNLRKRNELDMQKDYYAASGRSFKLGDIMDTDVTKLMNQYNNRMSGRAALFQKGYEDLKDLANDIDTLRNGLDDGDVEGWTRHVDDTIDSIMGYAPQGETPNALLASGYFSNAVMLKNSGLYQLTDIALTAKEFGMYRTVRAMMQGGLFKHARVELGNDVGLHTRLNNVLNGSIQNDMRFRWLHTYADDNTDLTRSARMVNVLRNASQAAYSVNGMRAIHRAMVNLNSGLVRDAIMSALAGSDKDAALLQRFGLRRDALEQMRAAHAADPNAAFDSALQQHLEAVGQRFMDFVVQQNRTGETSHFAEMNQIGRVLIGYQSFALAGTNKILRRGLENGASEAAGLALIMAYQFPLMALATYARYGMDGNHDKKTTKDLVTDAVTGMSSLGGATMIASLFTNSGSSPAMIAGFSNVMTTLQSVYSKGSLSAKDASKITPLAQEFIPLRILINNMGE